MAQAIRKPIRKHRRYRAGNLRCGYVAREKPWHIHVLGTIIALVTFLFSYGALMEDGISHAIAAFTFGFLFLLLIYGHHMDTVYLHVGDTFKVGAQSYDPESVRVEMGEEAEREVRDGE